MKNIIKSFLLFFGLLIFLPPGYALEQTNCSVVEKLKIKYLSVNQYNEFIAALDGLKEKDKAGQLCLNYYKAQGRFLQLKYLEEQQSWDDYFANGNTYREQLVQSAQKVIDQADASDSLKIKSRLLLWQFHYGQQDPFCAQALDDLIADINAYAKVSTDTGLIKSVADSLLADGEKAKARKIYKLYVSQLTAGKLTDAELKETAAGFYKEGNLELAQTIYDLYIERISKSLDPEKLVAQLFQIAGLFAYRPGADGLTQSHKPAGFFDLAYTEKIYAQIEGLGVKDAFNQESIYLRAFNLEKLRDYPKAAELYLQLIQTYPDVKYFDEAVYKIAMINTYILADLAQARKNFQILTAKSVFSPQVISSFYQLGLLAQWENDTAKAKEYYDLLLKNAADKYASTAAQTKERLEEIAQAKPLSYNLKSFMDLALKKENLPTETGKAEIVPSEYMLAPGEKINISSLVEMPASGCNQVELQYLWSGDLGTADPGVNQATFSPEYADPGTKAINTVIISPGGPADRVFTMVDVY